MTDLSRQLADLAHRAADAARALQAREPGAHVRLARPLEPSGLPAAVAEILAARGGDAHPGGPHPAPPWAPSLEAFQRQIGECQACPLGAKRRKLVFGEGNANAAVAFIGDGPGGEEDAGGRPFAGAAGQLLDRILAAMGYKRAEVYLCNVLKCRPQAPDDRAAAEACRPYLLQQLALLRPRVLVALGPFAAQILLENDRPLAELRGRWAAFNGLPLMPTFHPAELLRDPGLKRHVWEDMKLVLKRLQAAP